MIALKVVELILGIYVIVSLSTVVVHVDDDSSALRSSVDDDDSSLLLMSVDDDDSLL